MQISGLPSSSTLNATDVFAKDTSGTTTEKINAQNLAAGIGVLGGLTSIIATGTTNTTGATIAKGTYFYLNGTLVQAKADIASGATFTSGTNYEVVTAGGLNAIVGTNSINDYFTPDTTKMEFNIGNSCCTRSGNMIVLHLYFKALVSSGILGVISNSITPKYETNIYVSGINNTDDIAQGNVILTKSNNKITAYGLTENKDYSFRFIYMV